MRNVPTSDEIKYVNYLKEKCDDETIANILLKQYKEGLLRLDSLNCMLHLVGYNAYMNLVTQTIWIEKMEN